uniref:Ubiquitin carboxyl-terminal hydrolase n=1 Tax=Chenopodium quinoa TaxID=63459 RepID=A0A803KX84_CHEQI
MKLMVRWNRMKIKREINVNSLLKKFRSGFQMLSNIDWVSAYGSQLSAATVLGVVGLFLAVRDGRIGYFNSFPLLSAKTNTPKKLYFVPGLRNLGNNCFLNVVLQALASCAHFRCFLEDVQNLQAVSIVEQANDLPLLESLASLLEELSTFQEKSRPLNPHNVMSAMQQYIPQFQLSNQQDAAEAFLHLLSCLRDELSESYMPNHGSLADVDVPTSRILVSERIKDIKEPERWRQQYLGPFNGILGSFLTCQSCSSEIMMDFDFFHTLSLPQFPTLLDRFTLEDCMKRFLAPEHVENYFCSRCWHIAAAKFLSSVGGWQEEIRKLNFCSDSSEKDSCNCRNMSSLQRLPWSNHFSHAFKQLRITHCPEILCLHLQRSSLNAFGEPVKIQGHIYFPMILNLSPFVKYEIGVQKREINKPKSLAEQSNLAPISHPKSADSHPELMIAKDNASQFRSEPCSSPIETCSSTISMLTFKATFDPPPPKNILYRLVSVVEHFGRAGSGHYTVYRGMATQMAKGDGVSETDAPLQWFRISDSEVHNASEEEVLGAEATLLFYERI